MSMRWFWFARALILAVVIVLGAYFIISRGELSYLEKVVLLLISSIAVIVFVSILYEVSKPRDKETL